MYGLVIKLGRSGFLTLFGLPNRYTYHGLILQFFFQVRRSSSSRWWPQPGEHPTPPGRGHAEADQHQGRHGGRIVDGHRTLKIEIRDRIKPVRSRLIGTKLICIFCKEHYQLSPSSVLSLLNLSLQGRTMVKIILTHSLRKWKWKYHCTANLLFYWFGFGKGSKQLII